MITECGEKMNFIEMENKFKVFENITDIDAILQEQMKINDLKQSKSIAHALELDRWCKGNSNVGVPKTEDMGC